ncbi:unnamed protein product, partial [Didymodactylos carnosus]
EDDEPRQRLLSKIQQLNKEKPIMNVMKHLDIGKLEEQEQQKDPYDMDNENDTDIVDGPLLTIGEEYSNDKQPLILTYYRYMYTNGEHYNSTRPLKLKENNEHDGEEDKYLE